MEAHEGREEEAMIWGDGVTVVEGIEDREGAETGVGPITGEQEGGRTL